MFVRSMLAFAALAGFAVAQRPMPPMAPCPPTPVQTIECRGPGALMCSMCSLPNNETMVRAEVVILRLHPEVLKAMELCDDGEQPQKCCLTKCQVRKVMEMTKEDARCEVRSAPQIVTLDGQRAFVCIESANSTGMQFSLTPRVSLDHKFIQVAVSTEHKVVEKHCCGGSCATKCDDDTTCQRRTVHIHQLQTISTVPTGNSVMLEMYRTEPNTNQVPVLTNGPPVLSKIPYISGLFGGPLAREESCVCVIVTPTECNEGMIRAQPMPSMPANGVNQCQVIVPAPPMMRCPVDCPMPCVPRQQQGEMVPPPPQREENPRLVELMDKYARACEAGDLEKARKLARRCLDIDPTCFMRDQ